MTINPVAVAKGDDLVEVFRHEIHQRFFADLPAVMVDMTAERVLQDGHAPVVAEFLDALNTIGFAIKPSTASQRTGTSLNPLWREGCGATTAWRELLVQNTYKKPCAVVRLMTGSLYSHKLQSSDGSSKHIYTEEWDWDIVQAYCKLAVATAKQKGMTIYYPNKRTVSPSEQDFCQAIEYELNAQNAKGIDILTDDFLAQVVDAPRFTQEPFAALCNNAVGDYAIDVMMRANHSYAASSVVFTLSGAKVWEQSGGTNATMLPDHLAGKPVQHDCLDIFYMYCQAYTAANPDNRELCGRLDRLYQVAYRVHQERKEGWDTVGLLGEIGLQAQSH